MRLLTAIWNWQSRMLFTFSAKGIFTREAYTVCLFNQFCRGESAGSSSYEHFGCKLIMIYKHAQVIVGAFQFETGYPSEKR